MSLLDSNLKQSNKKDPYPIINMASFPLTSCGQRLFPGYADGPDIEEDCGKEIPLEAAASLLDGIVVIQFVEYVLRQNDHAPTGDADAAGDNVALMLWSSACWSLLPLHFSGC